MKSPAPLPADSDGLDAVRLNISFTERQLADMQPGQNISLPLTDEAKVALQQLIAEKEQMARLDELHLFSEAMKGKFEKRLDALEFANYGKDRIKQLKSGELVTNAVNTCRRNI